MSSFVLEVISVRHLRRMVSLGMKEVVELEALRQLDDDPSKIQIERRVSGLSALQDIVS
jgi:hypothetical protein